MGAATGTARAYEEERAMTTVAIFGGTGYAGGAIAAEAAQAGPERHQHQPAIPAPRRAPGVDARQGNVHDATLVDQVAAEADVVVVSIRHASGEDGVGLIDALPALAASVAKHGKRLGWVGGAASLLRCRGRPAAAGHAGVPGRCSRTRRGSAATSWRRCAPTPPAWTGSSSARQAAFGSYNPGRGHRRVPGRRGHPADRRRRQVGDLRRGLRPGASSMRSPAPRTTAPASPSPTRPVHARTG